MRYSDAIQLWRDGERRLHEADPRSRVLLDRVTDAVVDELRRRLGGPFTTAELTALYDEGTDWCFAVATRVAPGDPAAWDMPAVCGAAFARYARKAADYRTSTASERPPGMAPE